jgi:hypothetical protein
MVLEKHNASERVGITIAFVSCSNGRRLAFNAVETTRRMIMITLQNSALAKLELRTEADLEGFLAP